MAGMLRALLRTLCAHELCNRQHILSKLPNASRNHTDRLLVSPNAVTNISFGPDLRVHKVVCPPISWTSTL